jgi:hypothetical protein
MAIGGRCELLELAALNATAAGRAGVLVGIVAAAATGVTVALLLV